MRDFVLEEIGRTGKTVFTDDERRDQVERLKVRRLAEWQATHKPFAGYLEGEELERAREKLFQESRDGTWQREQDNAWKVNRDERVRTRTSLIKAAIESVRRHQDEA